MALQEQETQQQHLHSSSFCVLDGLYCEEENCFDEDLVEIKDGDDLSEKSDENARKETFFPLVLPKQDMYWDDDQLLCLISKEKETNLWFRDRAFDGSLVLVRKQAVDWIFRVKSFYRFNALTTVLAVNYFDRFITSIRLQTDKPWMSQLVAVACLSLATKVEEVQVPLLLDLQVEEARYVFEAKTLQRMELLILSALQWRMNPTTPLSFFYHIIRRFGSKTHQHWEFMRRCERLVLSVIADARFLSYFPSELAAAIMVYVIKEIGPCNEVECQLMSALKVSQEKITECYDLILDLFDNNSQVSKKRKYVQNSVIDASLSSDSSNDSWVVSASVSSSLEPRLFKRRIQEQQMRLPSMNRMFVDVLSSPH